jgi:hypothetical protein
MLRVRIKFVTCKECSFHEEDKLVNGVFENVGCSLCTEHPNYVHKFRVFSVKPGSMYGSHWAFKGLGTM